MKKDNNHLVIMAGGVGSRFWPLSTVDYPKQFIDVLGVGKTMIQLTAEKFESVCPRENMWVVTSKLYRDTVIEQLPWINPEHVLLEPCRRNTAPCIAYASYKIHKSNPKANIVVSPSDHMVRDLEEFQRVAENALEFTSLNDSILTLGMHPTRPETGYGYIAAEFWGPLCCGSEIFRVDSFKEKPDLETAREYVSCDNYFWNSGIFVWNAETIIQAFHKHCPVISDVFDKLEPYLLTEQEQEKVDELFPTCRNISVDYAIMEKAEDIFVYPAAFGWSDLGTFGSLYAYNEKDEAGNVVIGENVHLHECEGCIVHATSGKRVVVQGLKDSIVCEKDGEILVCRLEEEQRIKEFSQD